jgi:hypothetical protein
MPREPTWGIPIGFLDGRDLGFIRGVSVRLIEGTKPVIGQNFFPDDKWGRSICSMKMVAPILLTCPEVPGPFLR